jgi:RNA-directed DNA polymerase
MLTTRRDVADLLGVKLEKLTWWVWALQSNRRYTEFEIPKRSGGAPRVIRAPIKPIKDMQKKLAAVLRASYRAPVHAHGFIHGRGPGSNARRHQQQRWVLKFDIENFFPSINFGRVRGMFMAYPFEYRDDVATLLAQICCHKNELPQGAPTSPVISNLICRGLDKEFAELARLQRCYYSRYADDICFSTNRTVFPESLAVRDGETCRLGEDVARTLNRHGFTANAKKTGLVYRSQRQRVTGLVVNTKVNVSRSYVRDLRDLLHIWEKYGLEDAEAAFRRHDPPRDRAPGKDSPSFVAIIGGRVQRVGDVQGWDSPVYRRLANRLKRLEPDFSGPHRVEHGVRRLRLLTEGGSDVQHMLAAQRFFHERREFLEVDLYGTSDSDSGGGSKLLKRCEQLVEFPPELPCLALFDTDDPKILARAVGDDGWKIWDDNLVAVALATPSHVDPADPLCIELLYPDEVLLRQDSKGRRIYRRNEFDQDAGINDDGTRVIPTAGNSTLVQEKVFSVAERQSVGMGKAEFARVVATRKHPFEDVDFAGFRPTFTRIEAASRALAEARAFSEDQRALSPAAQAES